MNKDERIAELEAENEKLQADWAAADIGYLRLKAERDKALWHLEVIANSSRVFNTRWYARRCLERLNKADTK